MTNCYIYNIWLYISNQQLSLRQKGVKFLIVKNKKTNKQRKEKQNRNKKTKTKRKKHYFFFYLPKSNVFGPKTLGWRGCYFCVITLIYFVKFLVDSAHQYFIRLNIFISVHAILLQNNPCFFLIACIASKF